MLSGPTPCRASPHPWGPCGLPAQGSTCELRTHFLAWHVQEQSLTIEHHWRMFLENNNTQRTNQTHKLATYHQKRVWTQQVHTSPNSATTHWTSPSWSLVGRSWGNSIDWMSMGWEINTYMNNNVRFVNRNLWSSHIPKSFKVLLLQTNAIYVKSTCAVTSVYINKYLKILKICFLFFTCL